MLIELIAQYGLFLAKTVTIVVAIMFIIAMIARLVKRDEWRPSEEHLKIKKLNDRYRSMKHSLQRHVLSDSEWKALMKSEKKEHKREKKGGSGEKRPRVFVLHFKGDVTASAVKPLREEITAILTIGTEEDEAVVLLESSGGTLHGYGLAASQLQRLKARKIKLTVCVDEIAASGGYKMACVADRLVAAPYAVVGSIGVAAEFPNVHKLLKNYDIEYHQLTAGEYKRTVSMYGENTEKGMKKFVSELENSHRLFKEFVASQRKDVDIEKVSSGETWHAVDAKALNLVDELLTSDDLLMEKSNAADLYEVRYSSTPSWSTRLSDALGKTVNGILQALQQALRSKPTY